MWAAIAGWATEGVSLREARVSPKVARARFLHRLIDRKQKRSQILSLDWIHRAEFESMKFSDESEDHDLPFN